MEYITLNNGVKMPQEGYGVFQIPAEECGLVSATPSQSDIG